jgi:hypothetical protein
MPTVHIITSDVLCQLSYVGLIRGMQAFSLLGRKDVGSQGVPQEFRRLQSRLVERRQGARPHPLGHMPVDVEGRAHLGMAHGVLDRLDVGPRFDHGGGVGMPQVVKAQVHAHLVQ